MKEAELRKHRCCFTGHRPEKLRLPEEKLRILLEQEIWRAVGGGYTTFLTGMARGTDLIAGEIVLRLRERERDLRLICALPYPDFEARWSADWQKRYRRVLAAADLSRCICPCFSYGAYQARNVWMIDHSSLVIAVLNGEPGGTKNTLLYAQQQGIPQVVIKGQ